MNCFATTVFLFFFLVGDVCFLKTYAAAPYQYRSYAEIVDVLKKLNESNPDFVELFTAQERYGLSSPGMCKDLLNNEIPCQHWILRITNEKTLDESRPEVFFSGCLHGDERVGPPTLTELALLLVNNMKLKKGANPWLKTLVNHRSIYIMPMTNVLGYFQNIREENGIDPNRDFPYLVNEDKCMQTITARAVNELWREHIFQTAITFHGGMQAIGYEWGAPNHNTWGGASPDHNVLSSVTSIQSKYAGPFPEQYYPFGTMNDLVYPVDGGMEDWSYAGSWEKPISGDKTVPVCKPKSFGGYPEDRTIYENGTLRSVNILVETADDKQPKVDKLGSDEELFIPTGKGLGHVSRNIRLALFTIDIVEPYLGWTSFNSSSCMYASTLPAPGTRLYCRIAAGSNSNESSSSSTLTSKNRTLASSELTLGWEVGGALKVDETNLLVYRRPPGTENLDSKSLDGAELVFSTKNQTGESRWLQSVGSDRSKFPFSTLFSEKLSNLEEGDYIVVARARVDQNWGKAPPQDDLPDVPPQTHLANVRTNPKWYAKSKNSFVQGRLDWYSSHIHLSVVSDAIQLGVPIDADFEEEPATGPTLPVVGVVVIVLVCSIGSGMLVYTFLNKGKTLTTRIQELEDRLKKATTKSDPNKESEERVLLTAVDTGTPDVKSDSPIRKRKVSDSDFDRLELADETTRRSSTSSPPKNRSSPRREIEYGQEDRRKILSPDDDD